MDELSSTDYSSSSENESSEGGSESSLEVMGLVINRPPQEGVSISSVQLEDEKLGKMLAQDLPIEERDAYLDMLRRHSSLFITEYEHIKGVTVIEHHIRLKEGSKPVTQKLRRLGLVQQNAFLTEVKKLLKAGFIYPVEDSEWVVPCGSDTKEEWEVACMCGLQAPQCSYKKGSFPTSIPG